MNTKDLIRELLILKEYLRDDDNKLCTHIWYKEIKNLGYDPEKFPSTDFLTLYANKKFTLSPTIKRLRAKIQEENSLLRGKKYNIRKGLAQSEWQNSLGYKTKE